MVHGLYTGLHNKLYSKLISVAKQIGLVEDAEKDLYHSAILLKNMAVVRKEYPVSLDYMIEELSKGSGKLRPVFQDTLTIYRSGRYDEAFSYFSETVSSDYAEGFASILSKMDKINPFELVSQLDVFISVIKEARITAAMKQAERRSLIVTGFATASELTCMVNFCVVVVFLDMLAKLRFIF